MACVGSYISNDGIVSCEEYSIGLFALSNLCLVAINVILNMDVILNITNTYTNNNT